MNNHWRRLLAAAWLAIILFFGIYSAQTLFVEGKIQFDLLALLPQGKSEKMQRFNELMDDANITGRVVIAFGHENAQQSKEALLQFREQVKALNLSLFEHDAKQIEADYKSLFTNLYPFRAGLMSKTDLHYLLNGQGETLAKGAIANILSPFGSFDAAQMDTDPFGFFPRYAASFVPNHSLQSDANGNLVLESEGKFWHIYQGEILGKVFSSKLQNKISDSLLPLFRKMENDSEIEVLRMGAIFYSTAGAVQAQKEISEIGFVSVLGIILLLYFVFRSLQPLLLAVTAVASGLLGGLAACLYLFGSVHILALVFGCSLVGVAVDYALHYYCASFRPVNRFQIFSMLLPALPLGVLTSSIGYGSLIAAPFPGIQQMAVIACVGLLCTFFTIGAWGPYFIILSSVEKLTFDNAGAPDLQQAKPVSKQPMCEHMGNADSCKDGDAGAVKSEFSNRTRYKSGERKAPPVAKKLQLFLEQFAAFGSLKMLKPIASLLLISIFCIGAFRLAFDDDVRNFQSIDSELKSQEERLKGMIHFDSATKFLSISSHDIETLLITEEAISQELDRQGINYRALADLIPSEKRQSENARLKLEFCNDHFPEIARVLDILQSFNPSKGGFDGKTVIADPELIRKLPAGWKELVHPADDGSITGRIMINGTIPSCINENYPHALFIDPIQEYSILFSSYRQMMLLLVAALLIGFVLIISLYQGFRASLAVALPVVLSLLTSIGIFGIFGIGFSMFHTMGLLLVLCIGIDYALFLYWRKPGENEFLLLGNTLAAITTLLSFGLLALSSTAAIHHFGMTVFVGIVLNFLITTLFLGSVKWAK